jgi:uncharacterized short protein YbdD (DUF466 family)
MRLLTEWLTSHNDRASDLAGGSPDRLKALADKIVRIRKALEAVIGAPDYEAYLAHHKRVHPDVPPMSEKEFFRFAIDRRYKKPGGGMRCC